MMIEIDASQVDDIHNKDVEMDKEQQIDDPTADWESGPEASRHAPIESATHMKIDSPKRDDKYKNRKFQENRKQKGNVRHNIN